MTHGHHTAATSILLRVRRAGTTGGRARAEVERGRGRGARWPSPPTAIVNASQSRSHPMHTRLLRSRMVLLTSLVGCLSFFAAAPCAADAVSESYIRQHQPWSPQNMGLNALLWNRAKYLVTTEKLGRQRIDSGRATTTFQRLPGHLAPDAYAAQQQDPAERQKAALRCTQALQKFEEIAAKNH